MASFVHVENVIKTLLVLGFLSTATVASAFIKVDSLELETPTANPDSAPKKTHCLSISGASFLR
ncbi:MAG: hypothetical protein HC880_02940 [Bacteroidia bacterium]|nr:hypothetical protein [Bacteroidia bacterium]